MQRRVEPRNSTFKLTRTTQDRLLLEGVAYLLRQIWVVLTECIARIRHIKPSEWVRDLTMAILLDWLENDLPSLYPESRSVPLDSTCYAQ